MSLLDTIPRSHQVAVRATLLTDARETELVTVLDGAVTLDAAAASRGRADVTLVDDGTLGLVPASATDLLAPYGNEIRLERGVIHSVGSEELVALGVFRLDDVAVDDTGNGIVIKIAGVDRSGRIIDARFEEPYQIGAGTNYGAAILATIQIAYPDVESDFAETVRTTPQLVAQEGDDRWQFCRNLAASIGMDLYFDGDGVLRLEPITQIGAGTPDWDLVEGADGILITARRQWSRQGRFNRVIVTGENTGESTPARGVATDENPLSPTYYYGPFGKVPRFFASQFITTDDQAADAAAGMLARELGTTQSVSLGTVVNPAMAPGHVARITRARAGIDEDHILDQVTIPLSHAGVMTCQTRATQVLS